MVVAVVVPDLDQAGRESDLDSGRPGKLEQVDDQVAGVFLLT